MVNSQLFLIDAHALCYRSFYALPELTNRHGQTTQAVYGFLKTLQKILRDFQPSHMAVCFDKEGKTRRQQKFAEYKIQRPAMPDGLISQMAYIQRLVKAYQLPLFECAGYEADDLIATIVKGVKKKNIETIIVSDDKDMYQLVNHQVKVFSARKNEFFDSEAVKKHLGVEPGQVVDFIGLAGDSTDNIPGVRGIGKVSAQKLLMEFGSLQNVFSDLEKVSSPSLRMKLKEQQDLALVSRDLALLEDAAPIDFDLPMMAVKEPDYAKLLELFTELEFHRDAKGIAGRGSPAQTVEFIEHKLEKEADFKKFVQMLQKQKVLFFLADLPDEESEQHLLVEGQIYVTTDGKDIYSFPKEKLSSLNDVWADQEIVKITFDYKKHLRIFPSEKCVAGTVFDVLIAADLLLASRTNEGLPSIAWQYLKRSIKEQEKPAELASLLVQLYAVLSRELKEKDLEKLFVEIEMPLVSVLYRMEREGVCLDTQLLQELSRECEKKIAVLLKNIFEIAGEEFNLNSPKQLSRVLFEKLGLPVIKKIKTGFSTNEEVLQQLAEQHAIPSHILEYRQLAKLKSTYIDALPKLLDSRTGRIHASFNQTGAETGRLSSNHPNLQNIPIRTELGKQIRKAFVPSKADRVLIAVDYSQVELRILAHLSSDVNLKKAFQEDQDIHQYTASLIFNVDLADVTDEMRDSAKRVNFGIIYGMSAFGLAKDLRISQGEAQTFIDTYFARYAQVKKFMDQTIQDCEKNGYVTTLFHRRRYLPEINNSNLSVRQFAQRQAINTPVQGSAADLMKLAMFKIQEDIDGRKLKSTMIITVHDELVFDALATEEKDLIDLVKQRMENSLILSVPIKVAVKRGKNWLQMEKVR